MVVKNIYFIIDLFINKMKIFFYDKINHGLFFKEVILIASLLSSSAVLCLLMLPLIKFTTLSFIISKVNV